MARTLVIACGALAHELMAVLRANAWEHVDVTCLPAHWHNTPARIVPGVEERIVAARATHERVLVAYGDCGTGGQLDAMLARHGAERLPGAHCYAFFTGVEAFDALAEPEPGTFYLTDYLAVNFERLIMEELGIRRHPELREMYFGHYTRLVHLVQQAPGDEAPGDAAAGEAAAGEADRADARDGASPARAAARAARAAARALELPLVVHHTGLAPFERALRGIDVVVAGTAARTTV